jgi:enoyl-CoA hydratase
MNSPVLVEEAASGVALITLNRREKLNAMNSELIEGLYAAFDQIAADHNCRAVILTGAGRGFCSGLDLSGYGNDPRQNGRGPIQEGHAVQERIAGLIPCMRRISIPIISAVNGPAAGGGFALVLGSDIRIAASSAKFNAAFIRIGLSACDVGTSWLLPRLVGAARAHELMLTGRIFDAKEAKAMGLILEVVPDDQLLRRALDEAELIMRNAPMGVHMTKRVMWSALEIPSQQAAIDLENCTQIMIGRTADQTEALAAFLERRPPRYTNS